MTEMTPDKLRTLLDDVGYSVQIVAKPPTARRLDYDLAAFANAWQLWIVKQQARIEEVETEAAMWRALAGPMWVGDESEGHFVCLACNQPGADDGGCKTIRHLPDCEYAAALAEEKKP